ncbi:tail fiber assembly protein [Proteus mirabilis]|nr:tail fiber assembly protein [Proteus mirabilis]MDF7205402.1 tail fiber assembly protein [Proteus mirabilis]MDL2103321.1 tail fiber assembly protein [Proteus mirabilis]QIF46798.1 tail fiber assembly protein [Proteus mirabilis]RLZ28960.1 phage tail protein [Proteus mirabilis]HCT3327185.1 tail fiber assembly protein [Proteus mirabilis]
MNYYRDKLTGIVFAYDDFQVKEGWVEKGLIAMSDEEIKLHLNPPLTQEQLTAQALELKRRLMGEVRTETSLLQSKLLLGRISEDEKISLNQWLDYLDELEAIDISLAPDIEWPQKPE